LWPVCSLPGWLETESHFSHLQHVLIAIFGDLCQVRSKHTPLSKSLLYSTAFPKVDSFRGPVQNLHVKQFFHDEGLLLIMISMAHPPTQMK
jgi:hypothetical protein